MSSFSVALHQCLLIRSANFGKNQKEKTMSLLTIILNILLPPLAVFLKHGVGTTLLISILLTLLAWLPGVIHAFLVNN